jgi:O-antigen/teichoic acid export membrane protein
MIKNIFNNKVVKAGSWYTITNFFTKGLAFLTLPIFTRLLSTADYGVVNLYQSYLNIFVIIFSLDLIASVQRGKFDFKENYNQFISSVLFLGIISFAGFSIIILIFQDYFSKLLELDKILIYLLLIHSFFAFVQNFVFAKFRVEYNYKKISIIQIINSIGSILLSIFLITQIFNENRYLGKLFGSSIPIIIFGIILLIYTFLKGKKLVSKEFWKYALIISIPLIFHNLSGIVNAQFDRILINKYIGASETGIYSFAYNVGMIITVLWTSMNQAWVPWFFEKMGKEDHINIRKRAKNFRDFFTLVYILILFLSPEIIKIMADEAYWEGLFIVPFIFMAYYFNLMYSFEANIEFYTKKTHMIATGTIFAAAVNVILNIIFIPKYGYPAAAITTVISNFTLFMFHYLITNYILKIKIFGLKFHIISLIYVSLSTVAFIIFQNYLILRIIIIILGILFLYFKYRKIFKKHKDLEE